MNKIDYYRIYNYVQKAYCFAPYVFGGGLAFPPRRFTLILTLKCNLNCSFCSITRRTKLDEFTTEEWLRVIDQIRPFSLITISGGEPMLRSDFAVILRRCLQKGKVSLSTNGTLLNADLIRLCVERNVFIIGISLDGLAEKHDALRGKQGAFAKTVGNLEALIRTRGLRKTPLIDVKSVILENNLDDLVGLYTLANTYGADYYTIMLLKGCDLQFSPCPRADFTAEIYESNYPVRAYFDLSRFRKVYQRLAELSRTYRAKLRFAPYFSSTRGPEEINKIEKYYAQVNSLPARDLYEPCLYPWMDMWLMPDGNVIPCLSFITGNARITPLREIWNNAKHRAFRKMLAKNKIFGSCHLCCYCRIK